MIRYGVIMIENGPRTSIYFDKNGILSIVLPTALPPEEAREPFQNGVPTTQHSSKLKSQFGCEFSFAAAENNGIVNAQFHNLPAHVIPNPTMQQPLQTNLVECYRSQGQKKDLEWVNQLKIATYNSYLNSIINPNIRHLDLINDARRQCEVCGEKYEGFMRYTKKVCRYCASFFTTARKEPELLVCQSGTYQCPVIQKERRLHSDSQLRTALASAISTHKYLRSRLLFPHLFL
ncbi:hypothetical protein WR25_08509 [Diploscapter pachys]|uniref:Nuclear receptor domain-containing protein n=1 Tax=Diploscapter pachys TaxID=2018661 RepID=A0A2A2LFJ3_9BILA|nr:hypothetical protein WR25_08509 [Diploscapter pachys]